MVSSRYAWQARRGWGGDASGHSKALRFATSPRFPGLKEDRRSEVGQKTQTHNLGCCAPRPGASQIQRFLPLSGAVSSRTVPSRLVLHAVLSPPPRWEEEGAGGGGRRCSLECMCSCFDLDLFLVSEGREDETLYPNRVDHTCGYGTSYLL